MEMFVVLFLGPMGVGDYTFHLTDHCRTDIGTTSDCRGWVREYYNRDVWLLSGKDIGETVLACNHEMFHIRGNRDRFKGMSRNKFASDHLMINEDIFDLPSWVHYRECDLLAYELHVRSRP